MATAEEWVPGEDLFSSPTGVEAPAPATTRSEAQLDQTPVFSKNALTVLRKRYLRRSPDGEILEEPSDMLRRVASTVAEGENRFGGDAGYWSGVFFDLMSEFRFMPNSPTLMNAGRELGQLSACFVLPVEDDMESIFDAVKNTALIHKSGGGTGFSFSRIRPKDDVVLSTKGISSGPISFMTVFDKATETVKQGGVRRGANMAVLRVDHPDIREFITVKRDMKRLNNFNLSVAVTDRFMSALERSEGYDLVNPRTGEKVGSDSAREIFDLIVESAWSSGEPGIIFIDRVNATNPTPHIGQIEATNPCGEQPLLPYEACNLGSLNLARMTRRSTSTGRTEVDWDLLERSVAEAVRFLDDVIEVNRYPLPRIAEMVTGNRKIGLGVMGFADLLYDLRIPYDSEEAINFAEDIMSFISSRARAASIALAEARGPFPNFPGSTYDRKGSPPMRNATVTTIAPTGSISILAGCSSGIEPVFALAYVRKNLLDEGDELHEVVPAFEAVARERGFYSEELVRSVAEKGSCTGVAGVPADVERVFLTSHDISPSSHVRMQAAFQKHTDNAVSKTVNLPEHATVEDVGEVFKLANRLGCKGVTVYRDGSRDKQVLNLKKAAGERQGAETADGSAQQGVSPRPRPEFTTGITRRIKTGCGNLYVTINEDERGPVEIFSQMGKAGGCAASQAEAISRLVSLALRSNVKPEEIVKELKGISCHRVVWQSSGRILSCADAIGKSLEGHLTQRSKTKKSAAPVEELEFTPSKDAHAGEDELQNHAGACPSCGGPLKYESGCVACALNCGYSECG
ncbi:vitamin B12-dependent ribonucleotide reductase [Candidatus Fermentibacterales bacterium]|nr:vitamin B12-dependent ribonucleotide reductase [Candidatus Fermentibacterales bacterium]